jgi:hypothetical protein
MMGRLAPNQIALLLTIVSFLGGIAADIATGSLPEVWNPHLWLAWIPTVAFFALTIALTIASLRGTNDLVSKRMRLLNCLAGRVATTLADKLPNENRRISLGITSEPRAVLPQPSRRLERTNRIARPLPEGATIKTVFDECGQALLILGQPGAGKSVLLLELARDSIAAAQTNDQLPIPVLLSLDTWATTGGAKLIDWAASEISRNYGIGISLVRQWLAEERFALLLDGLDEVAVEQRRACVDAINTFRQQYGLVPLAVCSREAEYADLRQRLALESAIVVEPLSTTQIGKYLRAGGASLAGLLQALRAVPVLRELLTTPLALNAATAAFADQPASMLQFGTVLEAEERLWAIYTQRMFSRQRGGTGLDRRARSTLLAQLSWLANQMVNHSLSQFYIERMQPAWLTIPERRHYHFLTGFFVGSFTFLAFGLSAGMSDGLLVGVIIGLIFGIGFGIEEAGVFDPRPQAKLAWLKAVIGGLVFGLAITLTQGEVVGIIVGSISGLIILFFSDRARPIEPAEVIEWSWRRSVAVALGVGWMVGYMVSPVVGIGAAVAYGWTFGLSTNQIGDQELQEPNEGIRRSAYHALQAGMFAAVLAVLLTLISGSLNVVLQPFNVTIPTGVTGLIVWMPYFIWAAVLHNGGTACFRHLALRITLTNAKHIPWNIAALLALTSERLLLQREGAGHRFWHLQLRDFLATRTSEEISALADLPSL